MKLTYFSLAATAALIVLKLTDVIAWSWWWITAPLWLPFIFAIIIVISVYLLTDKYRK